MALSGSTMAAAILAALDAAGVFDVIEDEAQRDEVKARTLAAWQPVTAAIVAHITSAGVVRVAAGAEVRSGGVLVGTVADEQTGSIE